MVAPTAVSIATRAARADLYGDALNESIFMRPGQWLTRWLVWADNKVVDGAVVGGAGAVGGLSTWLRKFQTGYARSYALSMVAGTALVACVFAVVRMA